MLGGFDAGRPWVLSRLPVRAAVTVVPGPTAIS
jgi:hypothetical protein